MGEKVQALLVVVFLCVISSAIAFASPEFNPNKYIPNHVSKEFTGNRQLVIEHGSSYGLPDLPERISQDRHKLTVIDLVDIALEINPKTKAMWENARAQASVWAEQRSTYYPQITNNTQAIGGRTGVLYNNKSYLLNSLGLNYLLYDFGQRKGTAQAAKDALLKADLQYNQWILDVLRDVPRNYYILIGNKALVESDKKSLDEARVSLKAAQMKREAGVGTLADVLEAKSNEAKALYQLESDKGQVEVARGTLATSVGLPANADYDIVGTILKLPIGKMEETVNELIETALEKRPDLSASFAEVRQRESQLKYARALHAPILTGLANYNYTKQTNSNTNSYYGGVNVQIPIFTGLNTTNKIREARARLQQAEEELVVTKERVITETWNAHYDFTTALKTVDAAKAYLDSAEKSFEVSFGRYKEGAADIVELMTVQTQLFSARSLYINAKTNVHVTYANLIHAVGTGFENAYEVENLHP